MEKQKKTGIKKNKTKNKQTDLNSGRTKTRKRAVLAAAALAGSLLLGGCGDKIYIITGADGGPNVSDTMQKKDAAVKPDSETFSDLGSDLDAKNVTADACIPISAPLKCGIHVSGIINQGESLIIGNKRIAHDDVMCTYGKPPAALISVQDSCGNPIKKYKIPENSSLQIPVGGITLNVYAGSVAMGFTFGAKWIWVSVKDNCAPDSGVPDAMVPGTDSGMQKNWCLIKSGQLNQGQSLAFASAKLQHDDLMMPPCESSPNGLFSVLDSNGNLIAKLKVPEKGSYEFNIGGGHYKLTVNTVAAGAMFGAKWVDVSVYEAKPGSC